MLRKEAQTLQHHAAELARNMKKEISELKHLSLPERASKAKGLAEAAAKCNKLKRHYRQLLSAVGRLVQDAESVILNDAQVHSQLRML